MCQYTVQRLTIAVSKCLPRTREKTMHGNQKKMERFLAMEDLKYPINLKSCGYVTMEGMSGTYVHEQIKTAVNTPLINCSLPKTCSYSNNPLPIGTYSLRH